MRDERQAATDRDWGSLAVAVGIVIVGVGTLAAIGYANATPVTEADYEKFTRNCDDLEGEQRLVDGGLGMESERLNRTHVEACTNATYAEYTRARRASMRATPFNAGQWVLYGTMGIVLTLLGVVLVRQELRATGTGGPPGDRTR